MQNKASEQAGAPEARTGPAFVLCSSGPDPDKWSLKS